MTTTAPRVRRRWTETEDQILRREANYQLKEGALKDWGRIAANLPGRTNKDCRKRWSKVSGPVNKGVWRPEEDKKLEEAIAIYGNKWTHVATHVGTRHADQCAKRWQHSLDPELDRGEWTAENDKRLVAAVASSGRNWKAIGDRYFPARSATDIKNRYVILDRRRRQAEHSAALSTCSSTSAPASRGTQSTPSTPASEASDGSDDEDFADSIGGYFADMMPAADTPSYLFSDLVDMQASGNNHRSDMNIFATSTTSAPPSTAPSNLDPYGIAFTNGTSPPSPAVPVPYMNLTNSSLSWNFPDTAPLHPHNNDTDRLMLDAAVEDSLRHHIPPPPPSLDLSSNAKANSWELLESSSGSGDASAITPTAGKTMLVLEDVRLDTVNALITTLLSNQKEVKMRLYPMPE